MANEIYHHGVKGQKWGIRRYQNPDGSLTPAGKKRYDLNSDFGVSKREYEASKLKRQIQQKKVEKAYLKAEFSIGEKRKENTRIYINEHTKLQELKNNEKVKKGEYMFHKGSLKDIFMVAFSDPEFLSRVDFGYDYVNKKT